jgi:hypothetical protein
VHEWAEDSTILSPNNSFQSSSEINKNIALIRTGNALIAKIMDDLIASYKENDIKKCETNLLFLALSYNTRIRLGKPYDHELKHILFKSNFIRNPIGVKYTSEDFKNISQILLKTIYLIRKINDPATDMQGVFQKDLRIDDRLIDDLIDLAVYTNCFYQMNAVNSKRMDMCEIGKLPFVEQMMTVLVFFQDQARLLRQSVHEFLNNEFVTGMEFAVADRPVEYQDNLKGCISGNIESDLEAINEIVHYLYFQYGKSLKEQVTSADIKFEQICPYGNVEFERYMYIAIQRHFLCRVEAGIRYGYYVLGSHGKSEEGLQCYLFALENDEKYRARRIGILRREYQFQSRALLDFGSHADVAAAYGALSQLAAALLGVQTEGFKLLDFSGFHPDQVLFQKAEGIAKPKDRIVGFLTKDYYLDCVVKGVKICDLLCAYNYLLTLSEILFAASLQVIDGDSPSTYVNEICLVDLSYLSLEFSRIHNFQTDYAEKLLDRFVFHAQRNRDDDIFAQPLLKISKTQVILSQALMDQMNFDRTIERQFIRFEKNMAAVGHIFEKKFIEILKRGYSTGPLDRHYKAIPYFAVNTNTVTYAAFDGKDIEFDAISVLGDYLILTELKAVMTSYDLDDLEKRKKNITEAIEQLHRRADSVRYDWEKIRSKVSIHLPDQPFDQEHIILVVCTDAYDYTPLKDGDVFITDDSTYLKYFTTPYVEIVEIMEKSIKMRNTKRLWEKGYPDAQEFMNYLMDPVTIHPISDNIEKQTISLPVMDEKDSVIFYEDYILGKDPIREAALSII